jgi:hypothetical protein
MTLAARQARPPLPSACLGCASVGRHRRRPSIDRAALQLVALTSLSTPAGAHLWHSGPACWLVCWTSGEAERTFHSVAAYAAAVVSAASDVASAQLAAALGCMGWKKNTDMRADNQQKQRQSVGCRMHEKESPCACTNTIRACARARVVQGVTPGGARETPTFHQPQVGWIFSYNVITSTFAKCMRLLVAKLANWARCSAPSASSPAASIGDRPLSSRRTPRR